MKILICASGSGGHIYPALSLSEELRILDRTVEIIFLCTKKDIEKKIFSSAGFPVVSVDILPLSCNGNFFVCLLKKVYFLLKFIKAGIRVFFLLLQFKIDAVIGFGGIGSVAAIVLAKILGKRTLICEQNIYPGRANLFLAKISDKVAIGFIESRKYFKRGDVIFTGNPLRKGLKKIFKISARQSLGLDPDKFTILVFGGSQGANFVNNSFIQALKLCTDSEKRGVQIIHLTGETEELRVKAEYKKLDVLALVFAYSSDIGSLYSAADLAVCRAGAATLNEISYFALPTILVPYPYAYAHQIANAEFMAKHRAAFVALQNARCAFHIQKIIRRVLNDYGLLKSMSKLVSNLHVPDAAGNLAAQVLNLR
ncbi:MAG: hypothetical protein DRP78_05590 [Candidatus Omnitrophota bacterium]|nr:MAG: hypothetical protein DRP78_05590 [Candidatus Omnitrophota bacterium]